MSQENAENEEVREVSVKRSNRLTKEQDQVVAWTGPSLITTAEPRFHISGMDVSVPEKESPSSTGDNVNKSEQRGQMAGEMAGCVDPKSQKFPFCIVWTPIPLLT